jgi:class 3 adenylate cyclase
MVLAGQTPTGTVTFLFTDIEGSTKRWEAHPDVMRSALARHDAIFREAIEQHGGYIFKTMGDAFCVAFSSPHLGLAAAVAAQRALHNEQWSEEIGSLSVRMALHTGAVEEQGGDYFGQPLNRVARLLSAAHGGQVLLSDAAHSLVRDNLPPGVDIQDMGEHRLKDLTRPEHVYQMLAPHLPTQFPPLKTLDYRPNNLPRQVTALIGREKEVAAVGGLLQRPDVALVTVTGPGGIGKTRSALQAAAELLEDFADGVWFVDLAPLLEHKLVVSDPVKECTCSSSTNLRYQKKLSGPLLDRIDIHVEVPRADYEKLSDNRQGETSAAIRARVEVARKRQRERFKGVHGVSCNAEMHPAEIRAYCDLDAADQSLIKAAMRQLHLSARAYHRILKLSRTITDLAGSERIEAAHLAEAVQYRPRQVM